MNDGLKTLDRNTASNKKQRVLLVGIYDTTTRSLAPYVLRSYAESFPHIQSHFDISLLECSIFSQSAGSMADLINEQLPDIVGISVYVWNYDIVVQLIKQLRAIIILGGPQVAGNEAMLLSCPQVDFVITGDGEVAFKELLEHLAGLRSDRDLHGITTKTLPASSCLPLENLDAIPSIYARMLQESPDISWVCLESSRGCPMRCAYCTWSGTPKMRYHALDRIKTELDVILSHANIRCVMFTDSTLLIDKSRAKCILRHILASGTSASIRFELSVEQFDDELVQMVARLPNSELYIGIQTVNPVALKVVGRSFSPEVLKKVIAQFLKLRPEMKFRLELIYGLPGDNLDGFKRSLDYVLSLDGVERIYAYHLIVLPGSRYSRKMGEHGIVLAKDNSFRIAECRTFPALEIDEARRLGFYIYVIYLNYRLKDCIRHLAADRGRSCIQTIVDFMDSLPFRVNDGIFPDMFASDPRLRKETQRASENIAKNYSAIVDGFRSFSKHKYDRMLADYEDHFAPTFVRRTPLYKRIKRKVLSLSQRYAQRLK